MTILQSTPAFFKKITACLFLFICATVVHAQEELQIHHINVEDGDATMIAIFNTTSHSYTAKILIDGGDPAPGVYLLPYLRKVAKGGDPAPHFNYVILTHYHHDHLSGLTALKDGSITADSLIDPGGYDFHSIFASQSNLQQPAEAAPEHLLYNINAWLGPIKTAAAGGFVKGHSNIFLSFGTTVNSGIGHRITIGTVNGLPVKLECVAGWGNTAGATGIVPHDIPSPYSPNDYTLSFVLSCGQFRYFIGGDLGGQDNGEYIDQEDALMSYLAKEYPDAKSFSGGDAPGHICGFKADHHGSDHSNDQAFMNAMMPAITVTSAGKLPSWHLPSVGYLNRLGAVKPLSFYATVADSIYSRGVYFTNLQDFSQGASLTTAKSLFSSQSNISFDYGNAQSGEKAGYMILVKGEGLDQSSTFQVFRADIRNVNIYTLLADFKCHHK